MRPHGHSYRWGNGVVALDDVLDSLDDGAVAFVILRLELAYSDVIRVDWGAVSAARNLSGVDCNDLMSSLSTLRNRKERDRGHQESCLT
jgi:hypothetical protein